MKDNKILKKILLHYINLEYYANGLDEEFESLLEELKKRCANKISSYKTLNTKLAYNTLMKYIKGEVDEFQKELEERLEEEAEYILNEELDFLDETYNFVNTNEQIENSDDEDDEDEDEDNKIDEARNERIMNKSLLALGGVSLSKLLFSTIDGRDTTSQFADRTGKNILQSYETALRSGYLFGKNSNEVTEQVNKSLKQVTNGMKNGIRTAIPSYAKTTDRIVFLDNKQEVICVVTLDGKTCINCAAYSGLKYRSITEAPIYPLHNGCRCILMLASKISEPIPDFEEFVESLDADEQKHVLGVGRYNLWKQYNVELKQFINNGTVIPKEQIKIDDTTSKKISNDNTSKLVKKYYPKDTFVSKKISETSKLYVSKERIKSGVKDPFVYNSDKLMAKTLSKKTGLDVYMLTENGRVGIKHPDGFFKISTIEMKHIRGGLNKLGRRSVEALEQSENVFLYCDQSFSKEACIRKIRGSILARKHELEAKGLQFTEPDRNSYVYIYTGDELYEMTWSEIL